MATQPEISVSGPPPIIRRAASPEQASLAALLQFEGEIRRQGGVDELVYLVANETRRLLPYDQMFVLRHARIGEGFQIIAASSIAVVDRNAPLIQAIEDMVARGAGDGGLEAARDFDTRADMPDDQDVVAGYPFPFWRWQPLQDREGMAFAGLLLARGAPFAENETLRLARVGETVAHSWGALTGGKPVRRIKRLTRRQKWAIAIVLTLVALFPVRMTALAPVEVVAARPYIISAPFTGVVATIEVPPNAQVRAGQPLVRFEDVKLRNELALAVEKLAVARVRVERASSAAFGKGDESREIAILRAEYQLAQAEHDYAADLLAKSRIAAPRDGMAIYTDRREWEGRAVNVGEAIMQIADPHAVELRIDLPAREQMALAAGSPVSVWLDSQPLWPVEAKLDRISYQARPTPEGVLAFALTAHPLRATPQIGSRGTARIHGRWAPLIYSVLKRPIASLRQKIGL
jgi:multidrug resistance efflux pump